MSLARVLSRAQSTAPAAAAAAAAASAPMAPPVPVSDVMAKDLAGFRCVGRGGSADAVGRAVGARAGGSVVARDRRALSVSRTPHPHPITPPHP